MKLNELIFPKSANITDKGNLHQKDIPEDEINYFILQQYQEGYDYVKILRNVKQKFGIDAYQYARKFAPNIISNGGSLSESIWALPQTSDDITELKMLLSNPLPACEAKDVLYDLLGDDELIDKIMYIENDDPDQCVRHVVVQYIGQQLPTIYEELRSETSNHNKLIDGSELLSVLGHEFEK